MLAVLLDPGRIGDVAAGGTGGFRGPQSIATFTKNVVTAFCRQAGSAFGTVLGRWTLYEAQRWIAMLRFSLREILVAVLALAVGLSIWRTPHGDWIDIPLATLSFYFVRSLLQQAAATWRMLHDDQSLPIEQRRGGRLLLAGLMGLAIILVAAWFIRFQFATEQVLTAFRNVFYDSVQRPLLPRDLAILTMLAATGISHRRTVRLGPFGCDKLLRGLAAAVVLAGLMAYEADRTFITFLIYLAVTGIELYQPPRLMPPEFNVSNSVGFIASRRQALQVWHY